MKTLALLTSVAVLAFAATCSAADVTATCVDRPNENATNAHYLANRAPLTPSPFLKLPLGAVEANGWLGRYLELQRDGLSGKLGELSKWLEKKDNAWLREGGKYGWEELPYWLRGYVDLAYLLKDEAMIAEAKIWIEAILASQREDGYFGPANPDGEKGCDLWPNMLVLFLMQSYYEYTGDERVIDFMSRYFDWIAMYPEQKFLKTYWENSRAGDLLFSCFWLYNITGNETLLTVAKKINANTANWKQESTLPNWHNVNIAQCFRQPATWWMLSKDEADKFATYNDFWLIRACFGQVPGGMWGGDENSRVGYVDPRQGVETCGIFEQMTSDMILFRITGDLSWVDHCEDVAFNTAPAAVMPNFRALRYITCPNQPISDSKNHSPGIDNAGPFMAMNPFSSRCCQHNHTHGWPYYIENMWTATPDGGLAATLYGASKVNAKVGSGEGVLVTLTETTNYPFDDVINIAVSLPENVKSVAFPLYVRVPKWSLEPSVTLNDSPVAFAAGTKPEPQKWLRIEREWKNGDKIAATFPSKASFRKWDQNKGCVSIDFGPLTYSLKIKERYVKMDGRKVAMGDSGWQAGAKQEDWPSYDILPDSEWNYGLLDPAKQDLSKVEIIKRDWPEDNFPWTVDSVPYSIKLPGRQIPSWKIDEYGLCAPVPFSPAKTDCPVKELELVPMGAARLRISAFPVVEE
ncbi:MAG: glycoside hydrolase family 127 protein [Thermoguttaceae bacterium]|nr:glycoside hydrolase family 127 protein [Thermoguttaceae bacterium]